MEKAVLPSRGFASAVFSCRLELYLKLWTSEGTSIVATCCQLSSTTPDAHCDKLATVVGQTKLAILATDDV